METISPQYKNIPYFIPPNLSLLFLIKIPEIKKLSKKKLIKNKSVTKLQKRERKKFEI